MEVTLSQEVLERVDRFLDIYQQHVDTLGWEYADDEIGEVEEEEEEDQFHEPIH